MSDYLFHVDPPSVADPGDEFAIQVRLRSRCRMLAPTLRLVAVPNGGQRTAWSAMKAKNEGLAKGFPDLLALWDGGEAYLELKDRKGQLSSDQIGWMNWLHQSGKKCGCFRSVDTALAFLRAAGAPFMDMEAAA